MRERERERERGEGGAQERIRDERLVKRGKKEGRKISRYEMEALYMQEENRTETLEYMWMAGEKIKNGKKGRM